MSTSHTPGPYKSFDVDGSSDDDPTIFAGGTCLATVWINDLPKDQAIANTLLFAAAPEMLAALVRAEALLSMVGGDTQTLSDIRAAIAKAIRR